MGRGQGKAKGKDFDNLKQELELDVHKVQPDDQPEAEHEPKKTDFIDAFTAGTSRLRIVE